MEERQALAWGDIKNNCNVIVIIFSEHRYLTKYILEIFVFQLALVNFDIDGSAQQLRMYTYIVEQVRFVERILLCSEQFNPSKHFTLGLIFGRC